MYRLLPLAISAASSDIGARLRRTRRNVLLYALILLLALSGYVAALIGGGLYLSETIGPAAASMVLALALIATALIVLAIVAILNRRDRRRARKRPAIGMVGASAAATALPRLIKDHPLAAVLAAGGLLLVSQRFLGADSED
ncbi:MAG: hypothetical protein C0606_06015 [Hyphomicrobiales bacterium]|nr:MAG: hypothetical protein C0606_06015 [Hyphomicrobiales bacterium]